jgi:hypothetical protein
MSNEPTPTNIFDLRFDDSKTENQILTEPALENKFMRASDTGAAFMVSATGIVRRLFAKYTNVAPTSSDDETKGFGAGDLWVDSSSKVVYLCIDPAELNADWDPQNAASSIQLVDIDGSDLGSLQDYVNIVQGSGWIDGCAVTVNAGNPNLIDVAEGRAMAKATNTLGADTGFVKVPSTQGIGLTDKKGNFIYYVQATKTVSASTDQAVIEQEDKAVVNYVWKDGAEILATDFNEGFTNLNSKINSHFILEAQGQGFGFAKRLDGMAIGAIDLHPTLQQGIFAAGLVIKGTSAFNCSVADVFEAYYSTAGVWTRLQNQTEINNTQYNDDSVGLATLTDGEYGVHWIYIDYSGTRLVSVFGMDSYTEEDAFSATPPESVPPFVSEFATPVGKYIVAKNGATLEVISAYPTVAGFSGSIEHNTTTKKNTGNYLHLDPTEKANSQVWERRPDVGPIESADSPISLDTLVFTDPGNGTVPIVNAEYVVTMVSVNDPGDRVTFKLSDVGSLNSLNNDSPIVDELGDARLWLGGKLSFNWATTNSFNTVLQMIGSGFSGFYSVTVKRLLEATYSSQA